MFRSMRRTRQELAFDECARILEKGSAGVLGTAGAEGYPYALPLSFVYLRENEALKLGLEFPDSNLGSSEPDPHSTESNLDSFESGLDFSESDHTSPKSTSEAPEPDPNSPENDVNSPAPKLGSIVFHCARTGHKIDALRANPRVSFCVIDQDEVIPEEFATYYKSVIAFGTAHFVEAAEDKRHLLTALGAKYSPGLDTEAQEEIDRFIKASCVVVIEIEHLSGKQAKGLLTP